jgi:KaiC/GvpD/RAD55 family RecA-like ATPase
MKEINSVIHFNTGVEELDKLFKDQGISSDELVEVCGASGSGKTYFCLKLASLALLEQNVAVIYIDTSNYVNSENMTLVLKVSK